VRDPAPLERALRGVDVVYHLAGLTHGLTRRGMLATNTGGTANLLRAAERTGLAGRFVYCSSLAAVGPSPTGEPLDEGDPCRPVTWYGESKLRSERLLLAHADRVPVTILRPPAVYGPRDVAFLSVFQAAQRGLAVIPGRPDKRYSLVHADDLAAAFLLAARAEATRGGVFFAAHEECVTLDHVLAAAAGAVGRPARSLKLPESLLRLCGRTTDLVSQLTGRSSVIGSQRMREIAVGHWVCSSRALRAATGWRARLDVVAGFRDTVGWYRAQGLLRRESFR
jgi:nucleoside-diphosphate-sugar epimerase